MSRTTVVIVNYNGGDHLIRCLAALKRQSRPHDILVIDNASTDGSARRAFDTFPGVSIVPLRRNVGFARAVNIGARRVAASCDYFVTINPDTVPREDFVEHLLAPLDAHKHLAATAGTLVFATAPAVVASAGITVHRNGVAMDANLGHSVKRGSPFPVFGPSGGAAAYRYAIYADLGGFCDAFFLYLEDADLAWRMRLAGLETWSVPDAVAVHAYSASAVEGSPLKARLLARNRIWMLARCLPKEVWIRDRVQILTHDVLALGHSIVTFKAAAVRGRLEGIAGLPLRLRERERIQRTHGVDMQDLEQWIDEPIGPKDLIRLRHVTKRLAQSATLVDTNPGA